MFPPARDQKQSAKSCQLSARAEDAEEGERVCSSRELVARLGRLVSTLDSEEEQDDAFK